MAASHRVRVTVSEYLPSQGHRATPDLSSWMAAADPACSRTPGTIVVLPARFERIPLERDVRTHARSRRESGRSPIEQHLAATNPTTGRLAPSSARSMTSPEWPIPDHVLFGCATQRLGSDRGGIMSDECRHDLDGFDCFAHEYRGMRRPVYRGGDGPAIILMHELPGMVRQTVDLAMVLRSNGFTVYLPLFFGRPGIANSSARTAMHLARICISREWHRLAKHKDSPFAEWLRHLARHALADCGGPGVGAIGMCLTGSFALSMMLDEALLAPVLSQPAMPIRGFGDEWKSSFGLPDGTVDAATERAAADSIDLLAFRFEKDSLSPQERFDALCGRFGERFRGYELSGSDHSVLTVDFREDDPAHPTQAARKCLVSFMRERLLGAQRQDEWQGLRRFET